MFSAEYYRNIKQIMLHLANPNGRGFIFASSHNEGLIPFINDSLKEEIKAKDILLSFVDLKDEESPILTIQNTASANPKNALIVNFLDILVVNQGAEILQILNFGREILNNLNVPILFWATEYTRQLLANQAIDLYSQRRFADIVFDDTPLSIERSSLEGHFDSAFKTKEEYQNIKMKIALLETQLEEAKENNISEKSLCESLVPQLIKAYIDTNLHEEAKKIIDKYIYYFNDTLPQLEAIYVYNSFIGNYTESLKILKNILKIEIDKGYENSITGQIELAGTYSAMATTYRYLGLLEDNLSYNLEALKIRELVLPPNHQDLAQSYNNLSLYYSSVGQYQESLIYIQKAISISSKHQTSNNIDLASLYNNLAESYRNLNQNRESLRYNQKALLIFESLLPQNHPLIAASYNNIALVYYAMKQYHDNLKYNEKALFIRKTILPKNHPHIAVSYKNIAQTYYSLEDFNNAVNYMEKAIDIYKKILSKNHKDIIIAQATVSIYKQKLQYQLVKNIQKKYLPPQK